MLIAICIGLAALTALSLGSAVLIYGHLTGRVRKPVAIGVTLASIILGAGFLAGQILNGDIFGTVMFPISVFMLSAGAIAGLVVLGRNSGSARYH